MCTLCRHRGLACHPRARVPRSKAKSSPVRHTYHHVAGTPLATRCPGLRPARDGAWPQFKATTLLLPGAFQTARRGPRELSPTPGPQLRPAVPRESSLSPLRVQVLTARKGPGAPELPTAPRLASGRSTTVLFRIGLTLWTVSLGTRGDRPSFLHRALELQAETMSVPARSFGAHLLARFRRAWAVLLQRALAQCLGGIWSRVAVQRGVCRQRAHSRRRNLLVPRSETPLWRPCRP